MHRWLGYISHGEPEKVLEIFPTMSVTAEEVAITMLFNACAKLAHTDAIQIATDVLTRMPTSFLYDNRLVNSAVYMLMEFGHVDDPERLFCQVKKPDMFIRGVMMTGYNLNDAPHKCLQLFSQITRENIPVNEVTSLLAIGACSQIGLVSICETVIDQIPLPLLKSRYLQNALIDMWVSVSSLNGGFNEKCLASLDDRARQVTLTKRETSLTRSLIVM
jgi:hypothetical protein